MDIEKNITKSLTLDELSEVLDSGAIIKARNLLNALYPSEIADVIEGSPRNRRDLIWSLVSNENKGETLAELTEEVRGNLLDELIDEDGPEGLAVIAKNLDTDDLADIIQSLPKNLVKKTVKSLDKQNQDRLSKVLSFSDDTAGGLMNIYAFEKTNRFIESISLEVPATWFQSLNAGFIVLFAVAVGKFWSWWSSLGKESSLLFQMAVGVIIMALGFAVMSEASLEFERNGSSAMYYLVLAYLLHTLGELCTSPTAMALITKLAPVKYASIMMGTYFACTGFGNKLAASLGEWAQTAGEYEIFLGIFIFCTIFGLLVIMLMKPLKRLTHGLD